jgi:hypothetical protein
MRKEEGRKRGGKERRGKGKEGGKREGRNKINIRLCWPYMGLTLSTEP